MLYHGAWLNTCVVAGLAPNEESAMRVMRQACAKNHAVLIEVSTDLTPKALLFDKAEQILELLPTEMAETTELHELVSAGARTRKVAGAPFGRELTALFDGNTDAFKSANRCLGVETRKEKNTDPVGTGQLPRGDRARDQRSTAAGGPTPSSTVNRLGGTDPVINGQPPRGGRRHQRSTDLGGPAPSPTVRRDRPQEPTAVL